MAILRPGRLRRAAAGGAAGGLPDRAGRSHARQLCKTPLKELTRSRKFQQPALANLWKSIGKSFLRKRMAGHMALMPRAVTRYRRDVPVLAVKRGPRNLAIRREVW